MIIGFGHRKRVGKTTSANFLSTSLRCDCPGKQIAVVSFADKLKDICYQLYGWAGHERPVYYENHPEYREQKLAELNLTPREIWIDVGNKLRQVYERTWLDFALKGVKADVIIIPDVRYPNEAEEILKSNGQLYKIVRDCVAVSNDVADCALNDFTDWTGIIDNNGTLEDLNTDMEVLSREICTEING